MIGIPPHPAQTECARGLTAVTKGTWKCNLSKASMRFGQQLFTIAAARDQRKLRRNASSGKAPRAHAWIYLMLGAAGTSAYAYQDVSILDD
jgi:hypothetical protein